jgi:cyclophilin family peptidyl-prolyl cis-trans isomerase
VNCRFETFLLLQNFLALCASDYYNGCLFHRNIKSFIVQTGDPTHTGKGGNSIWGRKFEDEFKEDLKVCIYSESDTQMSLQLEIMYLGYIVFICSCCRGKHLQTSIIYGLTNSAVPELEGSSPHS